MASNELYLSCSCTRMQHIPLTFLLEQRQVQQLQLPSEYYPCLYPADFPAWAAASSAAATSFWVLPLPLGRLLMPLPESADRLRAAEVLPTPEPGGLPRGRPLPRFAGGPLEGVVLVVFTENWQEAINSNYQATKFKGNNIWVSVSRGIIKFVFFLSTFNLQGLTWETKLRFSQKSPSFVPCEKEGEVSSTITRPSLLLSSAEIVENIAASLPTDTWK